MQGLEQFGLSPKVNKSVAIYGFTIRRRFIESLLHPLTLLQLFGDQEHV
jgi:hypothetical protein